MSAIINRYAWLYIHRMHIIVTCRLPLLLSCVGSRLLVVLGVTLVSSIASKFFPNHPTFSNTVCTVALAPDALVNAEPSAKVSMKTPLSVFLETFADASAFIRHVSYSSSGSLPHLAYSCSVISATSPSRSLRPDLSHMQSEAGAHHTVYSTVLCI